MRFSIGFPILHLQTLLKLVAIASTQPHFLTLFLDMALPPMDLFQKTAASRSMTTPILVGNTKRERDTSQ